MKASAMAISIHREVKSLDVSTVIFGLPFNRFWPRLPWGSFQTAQPRFGTEITTRTDRKSFLIEHHANSREFYEIKQLCMQSDKFQILNQVVCINVKLYGFYFM